MDQLALDGVGRKPPDPECPFLLASYGEIIKVQVELWRSACDIHCEDLGPF
jgi:hypothetical protein